LNRKFPTYLIFIFTFYLSTSFAQYPEMVFPLHVGDRWQYNESGFISESIVAYDTTMPNNFTYVRINGTFYNGFFRKNSSKIYEYITAFEEDWLNYDFSAIVGDTIGIWPYGGLYFVTSVYLQGIENYFGQELQTMTFFRDEATSSLDGFRTVADGLGLVQYNGELMHYKLTGAVINGVQYGEIVDIEKPDEQLPNEFRLFQNYPNPFNPSTVISYSLPHSDFIKVSVYDILGRELEILDEGYKNAGLHRSTFNRSKYPSGVYIYSITSSNSILSKKMLLLK
jgi:hypothetical protein